MYITEPPLWSASASIGNGAGEGCPPLKLAGDAGVVVAALHVGDRGRHPQLAPLQVGAIADAEHGQDAARDLDAAQLGDAGAELAVADHDVKLHRAAADGVGAVDAADHEGHGAAPGGVPLTVRWATGGR